MSFLLIGLPLWREALRGIGGVLCNVIYSLISLLYQVFVTVAQLNILGDTSLAPIYQRVTMILTIVMTFYITFEFIKYIIQPDTITDKDKGVGNILVRIIVVIVLIAMVPKIFSLAYDLQGKIINQNVISKIILGTQDMDYKKIGYEFSAEMLSQFYKANEEECSGGIDDVDKNLNQLRQTGVANILPGLNDSCETITIFSATPAIDFNGFIAIVVGGFIIYMLVMYSIDLGTRYAQLLYLQIVAPIAIMGYILPKKDGIFQKWLKQCLTTYLDVFIRLSLIYFILLLISIIGSNFDNLFIGIQGVDLGIKSLTYIALVLGLLAFAKRAPKLLQELFPSSGAAGIGFGLGAEERKKISEPFGLGRRVVGGVGGLVAGGVKSRGHGAAGVLKGAIEGAKKGSSKDMKGLVGGSLYRRIRAAGAAGEGVKQSLEDFANDASSTGRVRDAIFNQEHWKNVAREQDRNIANLEAVTKSKDSVASNVKEIKAWKQLESMRASASAAGRDDIALRVENEMKKVEKAARVYATDTSNTDNLQKLQQSIIKASVGTALGTNLGVKLDANGNIDGSMLDANGNIDLSKFTAENIANLNKIIEGDSAKWNSVSTSVSESRKIANATMGDIEINVERVNAQGQKVEVPVKIKDLTDKEFAEKIGDISDTAISKVGEEKAKDAYKNAHAAAKGIDTSGK